MLERRKNSEAINQLTEEAEDPASIQSFVLAQSLLNSIRES